MERRVTSHTEEEEMNQRRRLLGLARKGDEKAIGKLFELYQVKVYTGETLKKSKTSFSKDPQPLSSEKRQGSKSKKPTTVKTRKSVDKKLSSQKGSANPQPKAAKGVSSKPKQVSGTASSQKPTTKPSSSKSQAKPKKQSAKPAKTTKVKTTVKVASKPKPAKKAKVAKSAKPKLSTKQVRTKKPTVAKTKKKG